MSLYSAIHSDPEGSSDGRPGSGNSSQRARYVAIQSADILSSWTRAASWFLSADTSLPRHRSSRGRKEMGLVGQASWISSVVNLLNTSTFWSLQTIAVC